VLSYWAAVAACQRSGRSSPARGQFPKYVGEVRKRRDTPQRACPRDAVENRSPLRRPVRAEEEEIVPAECDGPQLLFA